MEQEYYSSKHFTAEQIDQRLLKGTYDDAVVAGYQGTKEEFDHQVATMVSSSGDSTGNQEVDNAYIKVISEAIRKVPQTLTETEKFQARTNIGAISGDDIVNDLTSGGADKALSAEMGKELKHEIGDVGGYTKLTSSDLMPMVYDGTKMASSSSYNTWVFPLIEGETYTAVKPSYIHTIRTSSVYPSLGTVATMPILNGLNFVATEDMKYLVIGINVSKYNSEDYELAHSGYGLNQNVSELKNSVQRISDEMSLVRSRRTRYEVVSGDRLSKALSLASEKKYRITLEVVSGIDDGTYTVYGFKNGTIDTTTIFAKDIRIGQPVEILVPNGYDGIGLFSDIKLNSYREYSVIYGEVDSLESRLNTIESNPILDGLYQLEFNIQEFVNKYGSFVTSNGSGRTDYILALEGVKGAAYDGGGTYENRAVSFYDKSKSWIGFLDLGETAGLKEFILTKDNIPSNAVYCIISSITSYLNNGLSYVYYPAIASSVLAATTTAENSNNIDSNIQSILEIKDDIAKFNGGLGNQDYKSVRQRVAIWVTDVPSIDNYLIKVDCLNPPLAKF